MNLLDIIILILILWGLLKGLYNGLVKELLSLIGIGLAIILAYRYHDALGSFIEDYTKLRENTLILVSFASIFLVTLIVTRLVAIAITRALSYIALGLINRILGAVFGTVKVLAIVIIAIHFISPVLLNIPEYQKLEETSITVPVLTTISQTATTILP